MTSPEQNNAASRQTPNADDGWRALAVSKAGARAKSRHHPVRRVIATIATRLCPSSQCLVLVCVDARHGINRTGFQAVLTGMSTDIAARLIRKRDIA